VVNWCRDRNGKLVAWRGLLGQDQLVLAGYPQEIALAGVVDFNSLGATENLLAVYQWAGCGPVRRLAGLGGLRLGDHGMIWMQTRIDRILFNREWMSITYTNKNNSHLCCLAVANAINSHPI
jgi:hypothetical protein